MLAESSPVGRERTPDPVGILAPPAPSLQRGSLIIINSLQTMLLVESDRMHHGGLASPASLLGINAKLFYYYLLQLVLPFDPQVHPHWSNCQQALTVAAFLFYNLLIYNAIC